ncbi:MAG TPA: phosphoribosylformylglycinamidine synthase subunit PurQ [Candidatus Saccharimonadales bacterium]|nr:phosphoribosylformylglycinamidine synthase subunit PurQ [Candidatus Saccharimonadales bacterium]
MNARANNPKVLVPSGQGLNCEEETAYGYRRLGAQADIVHINDIMAKPGILEDYQILALVGGFSDGDHIASGKIHANRLRFRLEEPLERFIHAGKLVIGVCNGFQAMVKSGMLPAFNSYNSIGEMTLTYNDSGRFEDRWIHLLANRKSRCIWTKEIDRLYLPIRHGEGKVRLASREALSKLEEAGQVALSYMDPQTGKTAAEADYPNNPNGSVKGIAGICDPTGRVFGMMPHWEGFMTPYNHPSWTRLQAEGKLPKEGEGLQIARNGVEYAREKLV